MAISGLAQAVAVKKLGPLQTSIKEARAAGLPLEVPELGLAEATLAEVQRTENARAALRGAGSQM
eukprot:CAMPEP_0170648984 /NCGR_PEP_ID=MMETSP0224-20130122/45032_1 /TAXON_ID=285029 /ORGANISM="Togula jolla, Strain CCCM 725" /LENGTH=64 /DNA_ID=CAMNT_0010980559 /DNA_START=12 /DNA_END=203 /DNA_ORIENTATION=-